MTDYCAGCGERLTPAPLGGHYRCCSDAYWSPAKPLDRDAVGMNQRVQTSWRRRAGTIVRHEPLYLYDYGVQV